MKCFALASVGEAVDKYIFHPAVHEGRKAVPEYRKLQHDDIGPYKFVLLFCRVDSEIRILFIQIIKLRIRQPFLQPLQN